MKFGWRQVDGALPRSAITIIITCIISYFEAHRRNLGICFFLEIAGPEPSLDNSVLVYEYVLGLTV